MMDGQCQRAHRDEDCAKPYNQIREPMTCLVNFGPRLWVWQHGLPLGGGRLFSYFGCADVECGTWKTFHAHRQPQPPQGDDDIALLLVERMSALMDASLYYSGGDPPLKSLESDAHFKPLVRMLKLPEQWRPKRG